MADTDIENMFDFGDLGRLSIFEFLIHIIQEYLVEDIPIRTCTICTKTSEERFSDLFQRKIIFYLQCFQPLADMIVPKYVFVP